MEEQIKVVTLGETPTDTLNDIESKKTGEISISAEASVNSAARRIEAKRLILRRRRIRRLQQSLLVLLVVFSLGITGYIVSGLGVVKTKQHLAKAKKFDALPAANKRIYDCFGTVGSTGLKMSLPGKPGNVIGVGFHQAARKEAYPIIPTIACFSNNETTGTVMNAISSSKVPVLFEMASRGRGSALTSAMDIAMLPNSDVYSPVDGVITKIKTYYLYGRLMDYHVEIQPDGYPDLRVAIIHIENVQVTVGQKVKRRETIIARIRALPQISSQILKYLPYRADHVHIQVNPKTVEDMSGS